MSREPDISADSYQQSLSAERRKRDGVHYTPTALARFLVALALDELDSFPRTICDPTCGAGTFLLAAADALADRGIDPWEIINSRTFGADIDADAVHVARSALIRWAESRTGTRHGASSRTATPDLDAHLVATDVLQKLPPTWADVLSNGFDLVVGNPPFLSQLSSRTSRSKDLSDLIDERHGKIGAYADTASILMLDANSMLRNGGVVAMVQPQSFLSARDAGRIRQALLQDSELRALWSCDELLFGASIRVCAVVMRRVEAPSGAVERSTDTRKTRSIKLRSGQIAVYWGGNRESMDGLAGSVADAPAGEDQWGSLFAESIGLPTIGPLKGERLGSIATSTAGFRDEFYALLEASRDLAPVDGEATVHNERGAVYSPGTDDGSTLQSTPRLLTVGMIDPGVITWGVRPRRFGGRLQTAPTVDLGLLATSSPRVASWANARLVPKVLVATQTRIVEAAVDPAGQYVPVTPTISVEPIQGSDPAKPMGEDLWRIAAALLAPKVSVRALATHLGTGLSGGALRWSAKAVLDVELPTDSEAWDAGAALVRRLASAPMSDRRPLLAELGATMCRAHGVETDGELFNWWFEIASRSVGRAAQRGPSDE